MSAVRGERSSVSPRMSRNVSSTTFLFCCHHLRYVHRCIDASTGAVARAALPSRRRATGLIGGILGRMSAWRALILVNRDAPIMKPFACTKAKGIAMLVGVPKEIKDNEYRVGIVPSTVRELADKGHRVVVESRAGAGAGFADSDYHAAGAEIAVDSDVIFGRAELIVKVKEPLVTERKKLSRGQVLFTYLHLAPDRQQTEALMAVGVTAIAYETVTLAGWHAPASHTNVRNRRAHGAPYRRSLLGKRKQGPRRSTCWRSWCGPGERRNPGRWCRRNERSADRFGHGRRRYCA